MVLMSPSPNRRDFIKGALTAIGASAATRAWGQELTDAQWQDWQAAWRRMEAIATRRQWEVTPLRIGAPASQAEIDELGARFGLPVPAQLRQALMRSRQVEFGWHIPSHLQPMEQEQLPTMSSNRNALWDIKHIAGFAIPNFLNWKQDLANREQSEAPNSAALWENQFAFYELVNGDMLTIDMRAPDGPQPVRYFSHELETLHGLALAPDFFSFITVMSKLGFPGTEWASYYPFGVDYNDNDRFYFSAETAGAKDWLAFLNRDPGQPLADEPPPVIVENGPIERSLLLSARDNHLPGVVTALAAGARPDVVGNDQWRSDVTNYADEFATALCYAAQNSNIEMMEQLTRAGATINTRQLAMDFATHQGSLDTVKWLIDRGSRVNGWKHQRKWPLHGLIYMREQSAFETKEVYRARLESENATGSASLTNLLQKLAQERLKRWIDRPTFLAMVTALLEAGADADAPWDNGVTMLVWCREAETAALLIKHGADVRRWVDDQTALHWNPSPTKARLLAQHGADVNALAAPTADNFPKTPFQASLSATRFGNFELPNTLLALGADPGKPTSKGWSTIFFAPTVQCLVYLQELGLNIQARRPDGGSLLYNAVAYFSARPDQPTEVAYFDHLQKLGFDINEPDNVGNTLLHKAVQGPVRPIDIQFLLDRGADKSIRNKDGKRPFDLVARENTDLQAVLK